MINLIRSQVRHLRRLSMIAALVMLPAVCIAATADDTYKDAEAFFVKGEYSAAIIQLKNTLMLEPDNVQARLLLGKAYLETGDAASAEKEITHARDLGLDAVEWQVLLGRAYLLQGRNDELLTEITPGEQFPDAVRADILQL